LTVCVLQAESNGSPPVDGRTELTFTPLELVDRLSKQITPSQVEMGFDQVDEGDVWPDLEMKLVGD